MCMLKIIIVGFLLVGWTIHLQAQESGTLLEQLAALQGYIVTTENGYRMVEEGLHTIGGIRREEFNLHSAYFASLSVVNPAVKNSPLVAEIVELETRLLSQFAAALARWRVSTWLQDAEREEIEELYATTIGESADDLRRMQNLVMDGVYTLADGKRMQEIENIALTVKEEAEAVSEYICRMDVLLARRQQEAEQTNLLKKWMGF